MISKEDFLKKLVTAFKGEAQEHLQALSSGLLALEKAPPDEMRRQIVETIFREAHSLKGAARSVNATEVENVCQALEGVLAAAKRQQLVLAPEAIDVMHQTVDLLAALLSSLDSQRTPEEKNRQREICGRLHDLLAPPTASAVDAPASGKESLRVPVPDHVERGTAATPKSISEEIPSTTTPSARIEALKNIDKISQLTVKVAVDKLNPILLLAEELLASRLASAHVVHEVSELRTLVNTWEKEWKKLEPEARRIGKLRERHEQADRWQQESDILQGLLEFCYRHHSCLQVLENRLSSLVRCVRNDHHFLTNRTDSLLDHAKKALMVPFSSLVELFPKLVRDLAHDQKKEAELVLHGEEIEIDRRILEQMKDPFIHLVRNCLDHGIERPEERERKNKPRRGVITIAVAHNNSQAEITVADDGGGIRFGEVKRAAVRAGMISQAEADAMGEREVVSLLFRSGLSTSPLITNISGRGLGMSIVHDKVKKLGGQLVIESKPDVGTTFRIVLPLTLATFRGILVRMDERQFILPTTSVERVVRVKKEMVKTVQNRDTIEYGGHAVSLHRLQHMLGLASRHPQSEATDAGLAVVVAAGERKMALMVDEVMAEQEVMVKNLGKQLVRVRNIAGATVLGDGKVVPILHVGDLLKSSLAAAVVLSEQPAPAVQARQKSLMVAEDSITARSLLHNILEAAGYQVSCAVDGVDAFTQLRAGGFDLLVSDVDMPRMNGFDLTAKIRGEKKLCDLPVVLVTALASKEDKERGMEVGANAYIVKSGFDQTNLLEVIRRLI